MEEHTVKLGLLDYFSFKAGCMFLSDLHGPDKLLFIRDALQSIDPSQFRLEEWNDAVSYITGRNISFSSSEQAAEYLLSYHKAKETTSI